MSAAQGESAIMRGRTKAAALAAAALLAAGATYGFLLARRADPRRPNVIVILIDTLRRDHVGIYGYQRNTTPTIDVLANDNVLFANAYANSNWTKPSVASLFTGLYVSQHGVKYIMTDAAGEATMTQRLPEGATTLAEIMKGQRYFTLGVVENVHVSAKLGFSQGFEIWDEGVYGATRVTNAVIEHLAEVKEPFFAYVHYFDPHAPYYRTRFFETEGAITPGLQEAKSTDYRWTNYTFGVDRGIVGLTSVERARLEGLYDGEVRNADLGIARIFATLKNRRMYDNSWIIITADHGENFYEDGRLTHPHDCFSNPQMRIPLVMKMPEALGIRNVVVTDNVQLVDVAPTVMSYLGAKPLAGMVGIDVLPAVIERKALPGRSVVAESESGVMLFSAPYKYVSVPTSAGIFRFLYNEAADPLERVNLSLDDAGTVTRLASLYDDAIERAKRKETVRPAGAVELSKEEIEAMRSLGYLH